MEPLLKRPDYIVRDSRGHISELYCKVCGTQIAKTLVDGRHRKFRYLSNYSEMKIALKDDESNITSYHVTNLCMRCVEKAVNNPEILQALHGADIDVLGERNVGMLKERQRRKPKVVQIARGARGIT